MQATKDSVRVTFPLPRDIYEQVEKAASIHQRNLDDQLAALVESGLNVELTYQQRFDRLSRMYRERLEREGKLDQTKEEVLAELSAIREKVAREFYTD